MARISALPLPAVSKRSTWRFGFARARLRGARGSRGGAGSVSRRSSGACCSASRAAPTELRERIVSTSSRAMARMASSRVMVSSMSVFPFRSVSPVLSLFDELQHVLLELHNVLGCKPISRRQNAHDFAPVLVEDDPAVRLLSGDHRPHRASARRGFLFARHHSPPSSAGAVIEGG